MTKKELRSQVLNDTLAFVLAGNLITTVKPKRIKQNRSVRGTETRGKPVGGDMPKLTLMKYGE